MSSEKASWGTDTGGGGLGRVSGRGGLGHERRRNGLEQPRKKGIRAGLERPGHVAADELEGGCGAAGGGGGCQPQSRVGEASVGSGRVEGPFRARCARLASLSRRRSNNVIAAVLRHQSTTRGGAPVAQSRAPWAMSRQASGDSAIAWATFTRCGAYALRQSFSPRMPSATSGFRPATAVTQICDGHGEAHPTDDARIECVFQSMNSTHYHPMRRGPFC